jgi:hypothetical protein
MEKVSLNKLSRLQRFILVMLSEPRYAALGRREVNRKVKELYWGADSDNVRKSLSRAYQRLEDRHYIRRYQGRWEITTDADRPFDNGLLMAILAWGRAPNAYAAIGLAGPREALEIVQRELSKGVEVQFVGID